MILQCMVTLLRQRSLLPWLSFVVWVLYSTVSSEEAVAQVSISGKAGVATQRAIVIFIDLAQQNASTPVVPSTPRVIHTPMPIPHDLPLPSGVHLPRKSITHAPEDGFLAPPSPPLSSGFHALEDNNTRIPPDTHGAVGLNHLMVTLNTQVRIQDRMGGTISTVRLNDFWASLDTPDAFDPKIIYDPFNDRWIFTAVADQRSATSSVLIGVSQTSNPTGGWNLYRCDVDPTNTVWADYPSIGFNKDWIVVQVNMYDINSVDPNNAFNRSHIYVFDKSDLYAGGLGRFNLFSDSNIGATQVPAITFHSTLSELYLLQTWNSILRLYKIIGAVGSEVLTHVAFFSTPDPWSFGPPNLEDFAPQLGSARKLNAGDARMQNVVFRNGSLWAAHTVFLPAVSPTRSAVQWWQLSPHEDGNVQQFGRIDNETEQMFYAYPSIAVNRNNDVLLGYSSFSATQYASANYAFRAATDFPNTFRSDTVLKEGEALYYKISADPNDQRNRWGDYSNTIVDPVNDTGLWTIQEYAAMPSGGVDRWGTWWGRVVPDDLITNGAFEQELGFFGWTWSGAQPTGGAFPHTPPNYAILGQVVGAVDEFYQTITIPESAVSAELSFFYNISADDGFSDSGDVLIARIVSSSGVPLDTINVRSGLDSTTPGLYSQQTFSLLALKGQDVRIDFLGTNDIDQHTTSFRIDDVSVQVELSEPPVTHTLTIESINPNFNVPVIVHPGDNNNQGGSTTPFTRIYNENTLVELIAAGSVGENNFEKWQLNDSDYSAEQRITITMAADHNATAVYTTPPNPPPARPTGLIAVAGDQQVAIGWTSNSEPDLAYYVLYRSLTNGFIPTETDSIARITPPDTSFSDTNFINGTTYYYRLSAVDNVGNRSDFSTEVTATPNPSPPPLVSIFTEVGSNVGVSESGNWTGVAWGDYDNDGDLDLFVANYGSQNRLYQNQGNGTFINIESNAGINIFGNEGGVAWGDYDNDGDLDLYVANIGNANFLYQKQGNESFTEVGVDAGVNDNEKGFGVTWGDYDNDGDLDLYVANFLALNRLYRNNGDGTFAEVGADAGVDDNQRGLGVAWGDYDNDGDLDLCVAIEDGRNLLYRNNGDGTFTEVGMSTSIGESQGRGVAWGDYDNDGDLDLYVAGGFPNRLHQNQGNGTFAEVGVSAGVAAGNTGRGVAWGDYDNDGDLDLFVANDGQSNQLYRNNGDGTFTEVGVDAGVDDNGDGWGAAWGDYDNDGDLDLFVANKGGTTRLYQNNGTSGRWLVVKLVGTVSNRDGIGAQVTAVIGAKRQRRDVDGGSGYLSQSSLSVEFGFGGVVMVDSLIVRWPSGYGQVLTNLNTNQTFTITEFVPMRHLVVTPTSLTFEAVLVGQAMTDTLIVYNTGDTELIVDDINSRFFTLSDTAFTVDPGDNHTVAVTFVPQMHGTVKDTIDIFSNDSVAPSVYVPLSGVALQRGDLTRDTMVNILDIITFIKILLGQIASPEPASFTFLLADINEDGALNILDLVRQVNLILGISTKTLTGSISPVTVRLGEIQTLESGQLVVPLTVQIEGVISGIQAGFTFDPTHIQIGIPQLVGRAAGMNIAYHAQNRRLRLVVYSQMGRTIGAGSEPILLIPITVLNEANVVPTLTLSEVKLANPQAQDIPVILGQSTVKVATLPTEFSLKAAQPNPFNPSTQIVYDVPQPIHITLTIYNILGQEVIRLVDEQKMPGRFVVTWHGRDGKGRSVSSGVYIYRLEAGSFRTTQKMTLLK